MEERADADEFAVIKGVSLRRATSLYYFLPGGNLVYKFIVHDSAREDSYDVFLSH